MTPEDLRKWRKERDLTMSDLATLLGVTLLTVHRWETRKRAMPPFLELAIRFLEQQPLLYREPPPDAIPEIEVTF